MAEINITHSIAHERREAITSHLPMLNVRFNRIVGGSSVAISDANQVITDWQRFIDEYRPMLSNSANNIVTISNLLKEEDTSISMEIHTTE